MKKDWDAKIIRRSTDRVEVGSIGIGGESPISVQTMWKSPLEAATRELARRIESLAGLGCDLLRFAVPDMESAEVLGQIAGVVGMPLVADIHFDYKLALRCLESPVAKIRINPGNIGAPWKVEEVVRKAKDRQAALRVGINSGSLPRKLRGQSDTARAMLYAAEEELAVLERLDFRNVVFSLKSSDIDATVRANRLFSEKYRYPLHLGLTEAGPLVQGIVRSTTAVSEMIKDGIGDTIRISLSDVPENEVLAGREILKSCGVEREGIQIVSCPTCGRTLFDVRDFLEKAYPFLIRQKKNLIVAIMGCPVNGPGEAKHADIGITGSSKYAVIFKKGKIVRRVAAKQALEAFREEIESAGSA
jgi:(E)-4-hydroxy-3-methylbut-2-enyl-diphosphate synthase